MCYPFENNDKVVVYIDENSIRIVKDSTAYLESLLLDKSIKNCTL